MKQRFLPVLAALLLCSWSAGAFACEHEKKTSAAAKTAAVQAAKVNAVTADAKSGCTAEQAAACKASGASAAHVAACAGHAKASAAASGACKAYGASIVTASNGSCAGKPASASAARVASAGDACCPSKGNAKGAVTAKAGKMDAVVAGGSSCSSAKDAMAGGDHACDACAELALCDDELSRIGIETQVVPLKNGIMIVYTATGRGKVQAVQNAMTRRHDRLNAVTAARDRAKLCGECKTMRGAMASGKLTRETVNIGGGVLTVMTSSDPKMVAKLQGLAVATKT